MIKQFFRLLLISGFKRNGFHTIINIVGLSIGLAFFILFILFIKGLRDYDTFHENYTSLYRIIRETDDSRGDFYGTPAQLGPFLSERIPEIKSFARFDDRSNISVKVDDVQFFEPVLLFADNSFFEIFSFEIIKGNKDRPISDISSVVITEKLAKKYFGDSDPVGKTIKIGRSETLFTITAVAEDCPQKSSIQFDLIISFEIMEKGSYWGMNNYSTFILLNDKNNRQPVEKKIKSCVVNKGDDNLMELSFLRLQSMKDMRFEVVRGNTFKTIDRKYIYIFLFASLFILLLAIINYTNLSSAISLKRSKEVAIKKIFGSTRKRIVFEFLIESLVFSIIALLIAIILVELFAPAFSKLINEEIVLSYSLMPYFIFLTIIVGFLAGLYPSFYGSRFKSLLLLKETFYKGKNAVIFRNLLVLMQFGITIFLLISSITFSKQISFMLSREIGLKADHVYEIQVDWSGIKLQEFKNELKNYSGIESVCTSTFRAGEEGWNQTATWEGMTEERQINMFVLEADKDFIQTLGIDFLEKPADYNQMAFGENKYYILNKSAKEYIGWNESINKSFTIYSNHEGYVAAVVNDFNFRSLHHEASPSVILLNDNPIADKMHVRIKPGSEKQSLIFIRNKWKELAPANAPLIITELKQDFKNLYNTEIKTRTIIFIFTLIALIISMLGLLGLATFITLQRTKEIGIRKANGANTNDILRLLIFEFVKWVLASFLLVMPLAYLYIKNWLDNFSYHIKVSFSIFIVSGLFALLVALVSVIIQSLRASLKNPVESLRYE